MGPKKTWRVLCVVLFVAFCWRTIPPATAGNCALYARGETGVALYGAAGGWWEQAAGRYQRGQVPAIGAVLVFERTRHMPAGHVAVVSEIRGRREVLVDQSNWLRGRTTRGDSVIDTSPGNDWTSVSVVDLRSGEHGRDNPTFGFIYQQTAASDFDTYVGERRTATAGLVRLAVARDEPPEAATRGYRTHRHQLTHATGSKRAPAHAARHRQPPHRTARHAPARAHQHRHA